MSSGKQSLQLNEEGRVPHLNLKMNEVSNKVIICSSYGLAEEISTQFDPDTEVFNQNSNSGYSIYTGIFKEKKVTLIAYGIGFSKIEILVRELRAITKERLFITHIGTAPSPCGLSVQAVVNVKEAVYFELDYDQFETSNMPYKVNSKSVQADIELNEYVLGALKTGRFNVREGKVCSSPSYVAGLNSENYSDKGHFTFNFKTKELQKFIDNTFDEISTFENDVYPLFLMARRSSDHSIAAAAVQIVGADKSKVIAPKDLLTTEVKVARCVMNLYSEFD